METRVGPVAKSGPAARRVVAALVTAGFVALTGCDLKPASGSSRAGDSTSSIAPGLTSGQPASGRTASGTSPMSGVRDGSGAADLKPEGSGGGLGRGVREAIGGEVAQRGRTARAESLAAARGLRAVVTVPALAGIVGPLLPEGSTMTMLMKPGRSEHGYEFTPADLANLGRADLVVYVGLGLEPQVSKFVKQRARDDRRVVCFAEVVGLGDEEGAGEHEHGHHHEHGEDAGGAPAPGDAEESGTPASSNADESVTPGPRYAKEGITAGPDHDHDHGLMDPHLWLDPVLVKRLVPAVAGEVEGLLQRRGAWDEGEAARLTDAQRRLQAEIDAVDGEYRQKLGPLAGRAIVTHHAAFGRLAARYGLRVAEVIRPIEGAEPAPGQIAGVLAAVKKEGVRTIFIEPQFDASAAERLARAAGVKVGRLDPLGDGDWAKMMRANLAELEKIK